MFLNFPLNLPTLLWKLVSQQSSIASSKLPIIKRAFSFSGWTRIDPSWHLWQTCTGKRLNKNLLIVGLPAFSLPQVTIQMHKSYNKNVMERYHRILNTELSNFVNVCIFFRSQLTNGSLYINSVIEEQRLTGTYQCMATLPNVGSIVSRTSKLSIASRFFF